MILVVVAVLDGAALQLGQQSFTASGELNLSELRWVFNGRSVFLPFHSRGESAAFADLRFLNSYPLDQVGSGNFFWGGGKIYDWLKKGILLNWINFLHSRPEALRGASYAKMHFIYLFGGSRQANIRSNATLLQPRVCVSFFFNEIANRERSESCYITVFKDN